MIVLERCSIKRAIGGRDALFQGRGAADDLGEFAGDLRLSGAVVKPGEALDHVVGVFGGASHRDHSSDLLAHGGVEEALEETNFEGDRNDLFENPRGVGNELVRNAFSLVFGWGRGLGGFRSLLAHRGGRLTHLAGRHGKQCFDHRFLSGRIDEAGVDDVNLVDLALDVQLNVFVRDDLDLVKLRSVLELGVGLGGLQSSKLDERTLPL